MTNRQLEELRIGKARLEEQLEANAANRNHRAVHPRRGTDAANNQNRQDEEDSDDEPEERVILLHDSLCNKINDTILRREEIKRKNIWGPDLEGMKAKITDSIANTDVIVLQALTRDVARLSEEEFCNKVDEVVQLAATKAKKVVISLIVHREDINTETNEDLGAKADLINARINIKYRESRDIIICKHSNLFDSRNLKDDGIHLKDFAIPRLASNLKHKMAEALGIEVRRRPNRTENDRNRGRNNDEYDTRYRSQQEEGYRAPRHYQRWWYTRNEPHRGRWDDDYRGL